MTQALEAFEATDGIGDLLRIDVEAATDRIAQSLQYALGDVLKRRGLVVGMSGGIDSAVCAGLAVRALGADRVFGLMLPERDSSPESLTLATDWADELGIEYAVEDISDTLSAAGCYARRNDAIRRVVPEFGDDWRCKIALAGGRLDTNRLNVFSLIVERPDRVLERHRLPPAECRQVIAATNFKQRTRKMLEYYHADRLHYAVVGTPNRPEYDQGFFVKGGDGLADVKPIAHLYKTQVHALAEYLNVPEAILSRPPTTDTYSLEQSQEEFYFSLSADVMDAMLFAHNAGWSEEAAAAVLGFTPTQVRRAFVEIEQKRSTTRYLHERPVLVEPVHEIDCSKVRDHRTRRR